MKKNYAVVALLLLVLLGSLGCGTRIVSPVFSIPVAGRTTFSYDYFVTVVNNTGYICDLPILGRVSLEGNVLPDKFGIPTENFGPGEAPTVQIDVRQYYSTKEDLLFAAYIIHEGREIHVGVDVESLDFEGYNELRRHRRLTLETATVWEPSVRRARGFECPQ